MFITLLFHTTFLLQGTWSCQYFSFYAIIAVVENQHLEKICRDVLDYNHSGSHTMPAPDLYPHQWLWDSCFIAIGVRHYDVARAKAEIESLLDAQWANGMVPHMVFDPAKQFRRDRQVWRSWVNPFSTEHATSGITQPPLLAEAVWRIGEKMKKSEARLWYKQVLPALIRHHEWLMSERDPHGEGLVLQIHPWETGLDNTPVWMKQLHEHSKPWWIAAIEKLKLDGIITMLRRDTSKMPPGERITNTEALIIFDMIRRFRRKNYNIKKILHRSLFCIEDISFNAILARNNQIIVELAEQARMKLGDDLTERMARQKAALQKCWSEQDGMFYSRDFITHDLLNTPTIASLLPLYSRAITKDQAARLVELMKDHGQFGAKHPCPSVPLSSEYFDADRYWSGPSWINTNWLLIDGLMHYGFDQEADELRRQSLSLVESAGPSEYFSPIDGSAHGADSFSWTAALTLDLLRS